MQQRRSGVESVFGSTVVFFLTRDVGLGMRQGFGTHVSGGR